MPLSNLNNDHFTQVEMDAAKAAWQKVLDILNKKTRNLNGEERQKYGSISEENKLAVIKSLDYHATQPHLDTPEIDYKELEADYADRTFLARLVSSFTEGIAISTNIRITHDFDAYNASRLDYDYCKYKMQTEGGAGWEIKYNDLLQFFKTYDGPPKRPATES